MLKPSTDYFIFWVIDIIQKTKIATIIIYKSYQILQMCLLAGLWLVIHRSYESEPRYYVTQVQVNISLVHNSAINKQQSIAIKVKPWFCLLNIW